MDVLVRQLKLGPMENFIYLIACPQTKHAIIVDPAWNIDTVLEEAQKENFSIQGVFATHTHFDHVNGLDDVLEVLDIPVYVHTAEYDKLGIAGSKRRKTVDGDKISLGDFTFEVMHSPGHSKGGQCLIAGNHLISGDTLFIDDCGRTDLPSGDIKEMFHSLSRIKGLPDGMVLLPGHHYSSATSASLKEIKRSNLALRANTYQEFLQMMGKTE